MSFSAEKIQEKLTVPGCRVFVFDEVTSTNDVAGKMARNGAPGWSVILSESQTSGRGRKGRSFFSPGGSGLYMSIILKPSGTVPESLRVTTAAAVAVAGTLEKVFGREARIKWVNDIFVNGKKVCGILAESVLNPDGSVEYIVLGIGVNLFAPDKGFPEDISGIAGAVCNADDNQDGIRETFAAELLNNLSVYLSPEKEQLCFEEYRRRCLTLGRKGIAISGNSERNVDILSLNSDYSLNVRYQGGEEGTLFSGEVSVRV